MALQTSGSISLLNIATEFGGSAPHSLSEYYRGGGLVPDVSENSGVPTSGSISLADFYGAQKLVITITLDTSYTITHESVLGGSSSAGFTLESDGDIIRELNGGLTDLGDWIDPKAQAPGSYEVRATVQAGQNPFGTINTWLPLTTSRGWQVVSSNGSGSVVSSDLLIEIRSGTTVLDSTSVYLSAYSHTPGEPL